MRSVSAVLVGGLVLVLAGPVGAQDIPVTRVSEGDKVRVTLAPGPEGASRLVHGRWVSADSAMLRIHPKDHREQLAGFERAMVTQLEVAHRNSTGLTYGGVIGLIAGFAIGVSLTSDDEDPDSPVDTGSVDVGGTLISILTATAGSLIGAVIGHTFDGTDWHPVAW